MKKALSLILAALLVLTSVAALAEAVPSVVAAVITDAQGAKISVVDNPTINEQINASIEALAAFENAIDAFDAEAQDALKAIFGDAAAKVDEIMAVQAVDVEDDAEKVSFDVAVVTPYAVGQKVAAVVEIHPDLSNYEQIVADAEVVEEGKVHIELAKEDAQKIADALYSVLILLSEK